MMSYIDNEMKIVVAEKLGLQGLYVGLENRLGQKSYVQYYWLVFLRFDTEEHETVRWLIAVAKTDHWTRGFIASVNIDYKLIEEKIIELAEWDDTIIDHLHNLDAVASLYDSGGTLDGEAAFCEMIFETASTYCHFTVKEFPDGEGNLGNLWRKLARVRESFLKI